MWPLKRGEAWWVDFDRSVGSEIQKRRPAIIVSNDAANRHLNRVQVVPLTTGVGRFYPSEAYVILKGKQVKAMADQITTVSKRRLINREGAVTVEDMQAVVRAISVRLDL